MKKINILQLFLILGMSLFKNVQASNEAFTIEDNGDVTFYGNARFGTAANPVDLKFNGTYLSQVPIGTVLDWFPLGNSIPAGYQICNGTPISDPDSPFHGHSLPDLTNVFIRGASSVNDLQFGGSDTFTLNCSTDVQGSHSHPTNNPNCTDVISHNGDTTGCKPYKVAYEYEGLHWDDARHFELNTNGGPSTRSGQHRHDITLPANTASAGSHSHNIVNKTINILPPYYTLIKIIRIK